METRIAVALVASSYAPHVGGVEEHVRQVARGLAADGARVEVWTVDRDARHRVADVEGITVRYLPAPLPARSLAAATRFASSVTGAWAIWKHAYREFSPDMLHVHCFGPNGVYARALHRRFHVPLAVTSHGETLGDDGGAFGRSALLRQQLSGALKTAALVTAPSEYVLDDLRRGYALAGGEVVPNGVDLSIEPSASRPPSGAYILGVGRLGRMKGFDLLIDAFAESGISRDHLLLIGGDGPERGALERLAERHGVGRRVRFLGQLSEQQVADAMADARAVVVPSRSEAFGIVALEAWRSGAALIMTNRGGARSFVRDEIDGLLVDPTDARALGAAMERVIHDKPLHAALTSAGAARVHEFGWSAVVEAYEARYRQMVVVDDEARRR